jgi:hypothetical protein
MALGTAFVEGSAPYWKQKHNNYIVGRTLEGVHIYGMLSPLMCSLVVDILLWEHNDNDYYTVGYADDRAIYECAFLQPERLQV